MTPERIEQEQKAKWISPEESLPEYGQIVWVWLGGDDVQIGVYTDRWDVDFGNAKDVKCWLPIPIPQPNNPPRNAALILEIGNDTQAKKSHQQSA